jgi:kinesin family protein C1
LNEAEKYRTTSSTKLNADSSRSHCIYQFKVSSYKTSIEDGQEKLIEGVLNMIDLAGSENMKNTGNGIQAEECKSINLSLSCLSQVFQSIKKNEPHHPYRSSKLTQLLENYLTKDTKTLMIVNVSPLISNYKESKDSLQFAN